MRKRIIATVMMGLFLLGSTPSTVLASETASNTTSDTQLELSLEQAADRALKYSKTLKSAAADVYIANENEDEISLNPTGAINYDDEYVSDYTAAVSADYQYESAKITEEMKKDSVVAEARQSYYDLLQAIDKVELKKNSLAAAEKSYKIKEAYYNVGMLSSVEFDQAQVQYTQSQNEVIAAENDLNNTYVSFNQLVGLKAEDRPILTDTPVMENLEVADLSAQISLTVSNSPSLELSYKGIEEKEDIMGITGMTKAADKELDKAQLSAAQLKEETVQGLYNIYYSIKSLEESYPIAQQNVTLAESNLRVAKLKYEIGMGTLNDVTTAESNLYQAKNSLLSIVCNHDILKQTFYKPWAQ